MGFDVFPVMGFGIVDASVIIALSLLTVSSSSSLRMLVKFCNELRGCE
jgi:hypothetical protein